MLSRGFVQKVLIDRLFAVQELSEGAVAGATQHSMRNLQHDGETNGIRALEVSQTVGYK